MTTYNPTVSLIVGHLIDCVRALREEHFCMPTAARLIGCEICQIIKDAEAALDKVTTNG